MSVVVTVTQSAVTVTASPSPPSSSSSSGGLSTGAFAGILAGSLVVLAILVALLIYLFRRHSHHQFSRVANSASAAESAVAPDGPRINSRTSSIHLARHSQRPPVTEPFISPVSWPPIPPTSRAFSNDSLPRTDSTSPIKEGVDFLKIPPSPKSELTPPPSPRSQQFFIHRMLQTRAQASEGSSLVHQPSFELSPTLDASAPYIDEEQLLADAERTALRDVERDEEKELPEEEDTASVYSQSSAPIDHLSMLSNPHSRHGTVLRRKSTKRLPRSTESKLTPVAELPGSRSASIAANSSLNAQNSHGTPSGPMSSSGTLPLLTSTNFGKESTTTGSTSSNAGWGSESSGRASRYPSLAPSSIIGQPSQSPPPRSEGGTDWRHPPPGLSGLKTLQAGSLRNPHSPVEERPREMEVAPEKGRAHLRAGTTSSLPEVEQRTVTQSGIARIDVTF